MAILKKFTLTTALCALISFSSLSFADDVQDANKLFKQGQNAQALEKVNTFLATKPKDAQARFLKGLIVNEQGNTTEAISIFTALTDDYPELPEPYNNLAVLYASQSQYEKAKIALEMAIRTHPSYATAHENLGDIYAKLASQAYDKALQLDSSNTGAKTKLAMIGELISSGSRAARTPARAEPGKAPEAAPSSVADAGKVSATVSAKPAAEPKTAAAPKVVPAKAVPPKAEPKAPEAKAEPKAAEAKAAEPAAKSVDAKAAESEALIKAVRGWASAWSKKDVAGYLAHYAKDFKTPKGESRADWEKARRQRISAPKKIEVEVESPKVSIGGDNAASVSFRQVYRSDLIKASGTKTLVMVKSNGKWLIHEERVN